MPGVPRLLTSTRVGKRLAAGDSLEAAGGNRLAGLADEGWRTRGGGRSVADGGLGSGSGDYRRGA